MRISPHFTLSSLKRATYIEKPCTYSKRTRLRNNSRRLELRELRDWSFGKLWIAVGVTFPPEMARRRHGTLLHYKTTAILFAVAPLPVLPSPTRHSYIWSVFNFCFSRLTKIKKRFTFRISSSLILFPAVSLHMNSFVKFEFLISWNLWNRKLKIQF